MAKRSDPAERRVGQRLDKAFPVLVAGNHGLSFAVARNISAGGMFVETPDPESIGTQVLVTFAWPGSSAEMSAEAEVRYTSALNYGDELGRRVMRGMGLRFLRFLPKDAFEASPKDPGAYH